MSRFDKYWIGILIGLLMPFLFGWAYVSTFHLWGALRAFSFGEGSMLSKMLILSSFPDMALLFLFYEMDVWRLCKGVLIGSFPYMLAAAFFAI